MCMPAVRLAFNKISERQKVGQGSVCETAHDQATYSAHHVTCVYYRFFFLWLEFPWFQMEKYDLSFNLIFLNLYIYIYRPETNETNEILKMKL